MQIWFTELESGEFQGAGEDSLGTFLIYGEPGETGELGLTKDYRNKSYQAVSYIGILRPWGIAGQWVLPDYRGGFLMWRNALEAIIKPRDDQWGEKRWQKNSGL